MADRVRRACAEATIVAAGACKKPYFCGIGEMYLRHAKRLCLGYTKTEPLRDPLRKEARFQAIERELKVDLTATLC